MPPSSRRLQVVDGHFSRYSNRRELSTHWHMIHHLVLTGAADKVSNEPSPPEGEEPRGEARCIQIGDAPAFASYLTVLAEADPQDLILFSSTSTASSGTERGEKFANFLKREGDQKSVLWGGVRHAPSSRITILLHSFLNSGVVFPPPALSATAVYGFDYMHFANLSCLNMLLRETANELLQAARQGSDIQLLLPYLLWRRGGRLRCVPNEAVLTADNSVLHWLLNLVRKRAKAISSLLEISPELVPHYLDFADLSDPVLEMFSLVQDDDQQKVDQLIQLISDFESVPTSALPEGELAETTHQLKVVWEELFQRLLRLTVVSERGGRL